MAASLYIACTALLFQWAAAPEATASKAAPKQGAPKGALRSVPAPSLADGRPAQALARRVQRYYERTKRFAADFTQIYTRVALSRSTTQKGTIALEKPGKMRWDYTVPTPKLFLADGKTLYLYEPEEEQVYVDRNFSPERLGESLQFLWGTGRLSDSFRLRVPAQRPDGVDPKLALLELTPKKDATYARLVLGVDGATGAVQESVLFEVSGNRNHFRFERIRINPKFKADLFAFTPPPGVEVVDSADEY